MAVSTAARVSSGGTWKTPKPSCGMVRPSLSEMVGITELMVLLVLVGGAVPQPYPLSGPIHRFDRVRRGDRRDSGAPHRVLLRIANVKPESMTTHSDRIPAAPSASSTLLNSCTPRSMGATAAEFS